MTWDLIGHDWAARLLTDHIARGRVRHAYLITGPQGVGRRTFAIRLAQTLNCISPPEPGQACGSCPACSRIGRMQHPDLSVVQAEQAGGTLKVEQIRELQPSLSLAPYEARFRTALLLRFEEAHPSASNALLKTLEEPPERVVLMLTAESSESLLETIVSRCEVVRLKPVPLPVLSEGLQSSRNLPVEQARLLAHLSGGRPGYAIALLNQPERLERRQAWLEDHLQLLKSNRAARFAYVEPLYKDKETCRQMIQIWLSLWRDILLRAAGAAAPLTNLDWEAAVSDLAQQAGYHAAKQSVTALERAFRQLEGNTNSRLSLEVLLLDLPRL